MMTQELLTPEELQALLRAFPALANIEVRYVSPLLMPWRQIVSGAISVYGKPIFWELEVDTRQYRSSEDIIALAAKIVESHEQAATEIDSGFSGFGDH